MAGSASGQDEANYPGLSCPLSITFFVPAISFFFCCLIDLDFVSVHENAKEELGQFLAILTSCLVNDAYILVTFRCYPEVAYLMAQRFMKHQRKY